MEFVSSWRRAHFLWTMWRFLWRALALVSIPGLFLGGHGDLPHVRAYRARKDTFSEPSEAWWSEDSETDLYSQPEASEGSFNKLLVTVMLWLQILSFHIFRLTTFSTRQLRSSTVGLFFFFSIIALAFYPTYPQITTRTWMYDQNVTASHPSVRFFKPPTPTQNPKLPTKSVVSQSPSLVVSNRSRRIYSNHTIRDLWSLLALSWRRSVFRDSVDLVSKRLSRIIFLSFGIDTFRIISFCHPVT